MKITIQKLIGDLGETWMLEVPVGNDILKSQDPVAGITAATAAILRVADNRLQHLNQRLLDSNRMAQSLTPEAMLALRQTVEVMYGSRIAPDGPQRPEVKVTPPGAHVSDAALASNLEKALEAVDEGGR